MAAVAQKLIIAACQQAASGWKMKIWAESALDMWTTYK